MATFPATLLDDGEARAARIVALALVADAAAQSERLGRPDDADALHDFRVAVRRLRSWVRAQSQVLEDSIPSRGKRWLRRLARATSASRDGQVFAGWLAEVRPTLPPRQRGASGGCSIASNARAARPTRR